ncbi:MAG: DoxX family membrane protein [Candidatus Wildermuthbacteria bacterium]|nr:DoxX family membrane protein [Candidatus Wildermuthbacteria bacterium]
MTKQNIAVFVLRLAMGWLYLYAGLSKVLDPKWSAEGYLKGAKTLPALYQWFASPSMLPLVNFVNEWGLTLLGASLLLGLFVKISTVGGTLLMALYYLPILQFPYVGTHSLIVDEHIVYIAGLAVLMAMDAGKIWGLDRLLARQKAVR